MSLWLFKVAKRCILCLLLLLLVYLVIFVRLQQNLTTHSGPVSQSKRAVELVCIVLTSEESIVSRGVAVAKTWAKKLDKVVFACNCTNIMRLRELMKKQGKVKRIPANLKKFLPVLDFPILNLKYLEEKRANKMSEKAIVALNQTFDLYKKKAHDKPVFWFLVHDDTYVFVENLVKFLETKSSYESVVYGFEQVDRKSGAFVYEGSGIVLTSKSMKQLVERIKKDRCKSHGNDVLTIGKCAKSVGLRVGNTSDEDGLPRFHEKMKQKPCCSLSTISLHYVDATMMFEIDKKRNYLRNLLNSNDTSLPQKPNSNATNL